MKYSANSVWENKDAYDIVVVGAGHAGCEAALACARLGLKTIVFTVSVESIAMMPCNPNIGGTSKEVTMSNTINVNYMTRAYNQYQQKNAAKDQEKEDTRFADSVREKSEASGSIVGNSKIGSVSAKDMTMVEYKQYIYNSDKMIGGTEVCTLVLV